MAKKTNILDAIVWISLAYILIWLILKSIGVINTPEFISLSPYFAAIFGAGSAYQKFSRLHSDCEKLKGEFKTVERDFRNLETTHNLITKDKQYGGKPNSSHD